jgi:penicillin-binding protein-related factor A (putative recombinase)
MAKNTGRAFEAEISLSARVTGLYYQKLVIPIKVNPNGRTTKLKENPYDGFLVHRGVHIALELKSTALHEDFPLSNIEAHQLEGLERAQAYGAEAWILINMRQSPGKAGKLRSDNQAWAISFPQYQALCTQLPLWRGKPRKSIPREWFDDPTWFIPLDRKRCFDIQSSKQVPVWDLTILLEE